jgi:hypothetical protein
MTALDRVTLRASFQTGDTPNGTDYQNLIDSAANLAETSAQTFLGPVSFAAGFGAASVSATNLVGTNAQLGTVSADAVYASAFNGIHVGAQVGPVSGTTGIFSGLLTLQAGIQVSGLVQMQTPVSVACISTAQASARLLDQANIFVLSTVATGSNDSVRLPGGHPGTVQMLINATTASAKVFPPTGGTIDGGSTNGARDIFPSARILVFHATSATFYTLRGT